jgi:hypothetical protein
MFLHNKTFISKGLLHKVPPDPLGRNLGRREGMGRGVYAGHSFLSSHRGGVYLIFNGV